MTISYLTNTSERFASTQQELRVNIIASSRDSKYKVIMAHNTVLLYRTPANLKPTELYKHVPVWSFQNINSSVFIWKYLNRTIYRSKALFEGADDAFVWHLRNKRPALNTEEEALKSEFNLKIVYPAELFYKTHKIT